MPLSLYLLSFIICFDSPRWYCARTATRLATAAGVLGVTAMMRWYGNEDLLPEVGLYFATLFALCLVCHGELVRLQTCPQSIDRVLSQHRGWRSTRRHSRGGRLPADLFDVRRDEHWVDPEPGPGDRRVGHDAIAAGGASMGGRRDRRRRAARRDVSAVRSDRSAQAGGCAEFLRRAARRRLYRRSRSSRKPARVVSRANHSRLPACQRG